MCVCNVHAGKPDSGKLSTMIPILVLLFLAFTIVFGVIIYCIRRCHAKTMQVTIGISHALLVSPSSVLG